MITKRWLALALTLVLLLAPVQGALAQKETWFLPETRFLEDFNSALESRFLGADLSKVAALSDSAPSGVSDQEWASMQEQMRLAQYQFTWQRLNGEWAFRAPNTANGLGLAFGYDGMMATRYEPGLPGGQPDGQPSGQFGLHLARYGQQAMPAVISAQGLTAERARVEYAWNEQVTEWYKNTPEGLEHGLTLYAPPASGAIQLDFALSGDLQAESDGHNGALLRDVQGAVALRYDQLVVHDAHGRQLAAKLAVTPGTLRISIDAAGSVYPLTVDPLLHIQAAELRASTPVMNAMLGQSVAISGDVLVAGAPGESGYTGEAYVFQRNQNSPGTWGQVQILRASDRQAGDFFGGSVAISGDIIVVGAHTEDGGTGDLCSDCGAAYVFQRNQGGANNWGQVTILSASDAAEGDRFGESVAVSGDIIAVGAVNAYSTKGAAYIFERDADWAEIKILHATSGEAGDQFGLSAAASGDIIVIGANFADSASVDDTGAAYVFQRNQGGTNNWGQAKALYPSDVLTNGKFGVSVAVSGDVIVAGAPGTNLILDTGAAYVFQRQQGGSNAWGQVKKLHAADAQGGDSFGGTVAVSGDIIVVGASNQDGGGISNSGAAYVFERDEGGKDLWGQAQSLHAADAEAYDALGASVAISGDVIVAGAPSEDGPSGAPGASGAAYVFLRDPGGVWKQIKNVHSSEAQPYDNFGEALAISGDVLVVSSVGADTGGSNAGAVYVFQRSQSGAGAWGEIPAILRDSDPSEDGYFGFDVAVSGDVILVGEAYKDLVAQNDGAAYIFERDQGAGEYSRGANQWYEVKMLQAPGGVAEDRFGSSVAISGDVAVVGAWYRDDGGNQSGAAYVYQRDRGGDNNWGLVKTLQSLDIAAGDNFGMNVAVSGDVIVIGAWQQDSGGSEAGAAYVFQRDQGGANNWGQVKKLVAPSPQAGARFGVSVAVAGDVIAVGANAQDSYTGAAYVFQRDEGGAGSWGWVQTLTVDEIRAGSSFGGSVAVSRDVIVVGAGQHDGPEEAPIESAGAAFVFRRNQDGVNLWGLLTTLRASDAQANDYFGYGLDISGDVIVAGAYGEDGGAGDPLSATGAVYIYQNSGLDQVFLPLVGK